MCGNTTSMNNAVLYTDCKPFLDALCKFREERNLSAIEASYKANISSATFSRVEAGVALINDFDYLRRILSVYGKKLVIGFVDDIDKPEKED